MNKESVTDFLRALSLAQTITKNECFTKPKLTNYLGKLNLNPLEEKILLLTVETLFSCWLYSKQCSNLVDIRDSGEIADRLLCITRSLFGAKDGMKGMTPTEEEHCKVVERSTKCAKNNDVQNAAVCAQVKQNTTGGRNQEDKVLSQMKESLLNEKGIEVNEITNASQKKTITPGISSKFKTNSGYFRNRPSETKTQKSTENVNEIKYQYEIKANDFQVNISKIETKSVPSSNQRPKTLEIKRKSRSANKRTASTTTTTTTTTTTLTTSKTREKSDGRASVLKTHPTFIVKNPTTVVKKRKQVPLRFRCHRIFYHDFSKRSDNAKCGGSSLEEKMLNRLDRFRPSVGRKFAVFLGDLHEIAVRFKQDHVQSRFFCDCKLPKTLDQIKAGFEKSKQGISAVIVLAQYTASVTEQDEAGINDRIDALVAFCKKTLKIAEQIVVVCGIAQTNKPSRLQKSLVASVESLDLHDRVSVLSNLIKNDRINFADEAGKKLSQLGVDRVYKSLNKYI